jgi:hypothetical protein
MKKPTWDDILSSYAPGKAGASKADFPPSLDTSDAMEIPPVTEDVSIVDQLENDTLPRAVMDKKRKRDEPAKKSRSRTIIVDDVDINFEIDPALPVHGFEYTSKEEDDARFLRKLAKISLTSQQHGNLLPDQREALRYIDQLTAAEQPPWYEHSLRQLSEAKLQYPAQPVLSRTYLKHYLRQAHGDERECNRPNCKSLEMGGFRCRELLMPGDFHPAVCGWCYICHLYEAARLFAESLNMPSDEGGHVYAIHSFTVFTDQLGEYRLDRTIQGEDGVPGIFGPFPLFNVHNYVKVRNVHGQYGWRESDSLVFQEPSKVLPPNGFSRTTQRATASY